MAQVTNKELLSFLKQHYFEGGMIDKLKVYYRPLVCPFTELISLVLPGQKVGDIGCGSGQFCLLLARFTEASSVYGIEISQRLVDNARQLFEKAGFSNYKFEPFDGQHFPEEIRELDIIFLNDVLHHVPVKQQESFMHDLIGMMKPGATLVLKDINNEGFFVYFNKMHDMIFAREIGHELPVKTATQWLTDNQLSVEQTTIKRMYVYPHYTIVAKKPVH